MTASRETILAAIPPVPPQRDMIAREAAALLADPALIRPDFSGCNLADLFAEQVVREAIGATLQRIASLRDLPEAVADYLERFGLSPAIALQPAADLRALDWGGITTRDTITPDEAVAVEMAQWGIAETGSVVFHSGPDTPVLFHFLPLHHIVALRASTIVAYLEDYAALAAPAPRNANIITGASGTTDIEGSYVRGAHGPGFLHIVLISN